MDKETNEQWYGVLIHDLTTHNRRSLNRLREELIEGYPFIQGLINQPNFHSVAWVIDNVETKIWIEG